MIPATFHIRIFAKRNRVCHVTDKLIKTSKKQTETINKVGMSTQKISKSKYSGR